MKISLEDKTFYEENGYLILRNVINTDIIDKFISSVSHVISLEAGERCDNKTQEQILNEVIIKVKNDNKSSSSWIYQTINNSYALKEFFVNINISNIVQQLLNIEDKNNLGTVSPSFRFDIPGDTNNIRKWHQDSNYFLENHLGEEHLVAWIPLNSAYKDNGSVIIAPKTHKNGRFTSEHTSSDEFISEQYICPEELYKNVKKEYIYAEPGDIAFINMDLAHSSGINITNNSVRYTAQIRFNTINRKNYRPVFTKPEYPIYKRLND